MVSRIVVPLDGTELGDAAIPFATSIARRTGAGIEFVHVHQYHEEEPYLADVTPYQFEGEPERDERHDGRVTENERAWIHGLAARLHDESGVKVTDRVLGGRVPDALLEEVTRLAADLVVMGARPRHGIAALLDGSVSRALVRHANLPVLLVRPRGHFPAATEPSIRRILVPLDGSSFAEQILEPATDLARSLGARITLFHATSPLGPSANRYMGAATDLLAPEHVDAAEYLNAVAGRMADLAEPPEVVTAAHHLAADGIIERIESGVFDLIAMTTHGRSGLSKLLAGSTADRVLAETHLPVLLLRPHAH